MQGCRICPLFIILHKVTLGKGLWVISIFLLCVSSYSIIIHLLVKSQLSANPVKALPFFSCLNSWGFPESFPKAFFVCVIRLEIVLHVLPDGRKDPLDTLGNHCYRIQTMSLPHVGNLTMPELSWAAA